MAARRRDAVVAPAQKESGQPSPNGSISKEAKGASRPLFKPGVPPFLREYAERKHGDWVSRNPSVIERWIVDGFQIPFGRVLARNLGTAIERLRNDEWSLLNNERIAKLLGVPKEKLSQFTNPAYWKDEEYFTAEEVCGVSKTYQCVAAIIENCDELAFDQIVEQSPKEQIAPFCYALALRRCKVKEPPKSTVRKILGKVKPEPDAETLPLPKLCRINFLRLVAFVNIQQAELNHWLEENEPLAWDGAPGFALADIDKKIQQRDGKFTGVGEFKSFLEEWLDAYLVMLQVVPFRWEVL